MTTEAELVALQQLYELKKIRAKQRINEQRQAVDVALREAEQQRVAVQNLQTELQANRQYRSEHGVSSDAQKIVDALSHRERIENSLERQSYYLLVAEEDLGDQRRELDVRHRAMGLPVVSKATAVPDEYQLIFRLMHGWRRKRKI